VNHGRPPSGALSSDVAPEVAVLAGDQELRMLARMAAAGPLESSRAGTEGKPPGSLITPHQRCQLAQLGKPLLKALAVGSEWDRRGWSRGAASVWVVANRGYAV